MNRPRSKKALLGQAFIDAIRECLGKKPLYNDHAHVPPERRFAGNTWTWPLMSNTSRTRMEVI